MIDTILLCTDYFYKKLPFNLDILINHIIKYTLNSVNLKDDE